MTSLKNRKIITNTTYVIELSDDEVKVLQVALHHYKENPQYAYKEKAQALLNELYEYTDEKEPAPEGTGS